MLTISFVRFWPESKTLESGEVAKHRIEGVSDGFIPDLVERNKSIIDGTIAIESDDAIAEMRRLAKEYGLFVGPSSGANVLAAKKLQQMGYQNVVTFLCDEGEKYIQEHFSF